MDVLLINKKTGEKRLLQVILYSEVEQYFKDNNLSENNLSEDDFEIEVCVY